MEISLTSTRTLEELFDQFGGDAEGPGFTKTHVPLKLALYSMDKLISRSQAKRVLARFEKFKEVILDCDGVEMIGQSFADEIFRVFAARNPDVAIYTVRANARVQRMIQHVKAASLNPPKSPSLFSDFESD